MDHLSDWCASLLRWETFLPSAFHHGCAIDIASLTTSQQCLMTGGASLAAILAPFVNAMTSYFPNTCVTIGSLLRSPQRPPPPEEFVRHTSLKNSVAKPYYYASERSFGTGVVARSADGKLADLNPRRLASLNAEKES